MTFANSLDPDQARQNVRPDLSPNCLTLMVFLKEYFEKVDFEKNQQKTIEMHTILTKRQQTYLTRHFSLQIQEDSFSIISQQ